MLQQETGEVKLYEDGSVEFETLTDDEEITIPSQDRDRDISDLRNVNIRDEQTLENTQQEDWLLPTEPIHGARPRQTDRERPPVIDNPALRDATDRDAAEISAVRHPSRTLRLSLGRRIFMAEEVCTLATCADTWTVSLRRPQLETWWTVAGFVPNILRGHRQGQRGYQGGCVTGLRSDQNQLEDLLRRIVSAVKRPAPIPEISDMEKLLLQLAREPPDGPAAVVDTPVPPTLEQILRSFLDGQR